MTGSMMDPEWKLQARVEVFRARAIERGNRIERLQRLLGRARAKNCRYHRALRELQRLAKIGESVEWLITNQDPEPNNLDRQIIDLNLSNGEYRVFTNDLHRHEGNETLINALNTAVKAVTEIRLKRQKDEFIREHLQTAAIDAEAN